MAGNVRPLTGNDCLLTQIVKDIHAEGILPDDTGEDQDEEDEGHGAHFAFVVAISFILM
jgi:hypothetical protein